MSPLEPSAESDSSSYKSVRTKVTALFRELVGDQADRLCNDLCDSAFAKTVATSLINEHEIAERPARDIGFHLSDWHAEAAFLVAAHLFPDRFTPAEISAGVSAFLIHAPNHVAAAAALYGNPVQDIFEVGALDGPDDEETPPDAIP